MIRHITYTSENMTRSAVLCSDSAIKHGCGTSHIYTHADLDEDFKQRNAEILSQPRGAGYWIWKPQIILQELTKSNDGDIVIYTDAGVEFINSVNHLIPSMDDWYMFFGGQYRHFDWCKGDCLPEGEEHAQARQLQASVLLFKVCTYSKLFIHDWIEYCEIEGTIDDSPTTLIQNDNGFKEHRHDQAILTTLQLNFKMHSHYWPASYLDGKFDYPKNEHKDAYPIIFNHHRRRNDEWK